MHHDTPYYLIDELRMKDAMEKIRFVQEGSGAKCILALKCFSSWCAFPFMKKYMTGVTTSSLHEARLGREKFGGEVHGYSVAFAEDEIDEVVSYCDKLIFNSLGQLARFEGRASSCSLGLRLNPEVGHSDHALSNPVGPFSRLGVRAAQLTSGTALGIDGAMVHMNCDNASFSSFCTQLRSIEHSFGEVFSRLKWLSLGGGIAFTNEGYPLSDFCQVLKEFSQKYGLQLYLEPGEAAVKNSTSLHVRVLDIVDNGVPSVVVDAGVETHILDVLTYDYTPELRGATALARGTDGLGDATGHVYRVCGRSCLAGDVFGNYRFAEEVRVGQELCFPDIGGYSIVKKNHFNGLKMPVIVHRQENGELSVAHRPSYEEFRDGLS
jgi:carboxynorspermidine decarboxylase